MHPGAPKPLQGHLVLRPSMLIAHIFLSVFMAACSTAEKAVRHTDRQEARQWESQRLALSEKLGIHLDKDSNLKLAAAVVEWLGVPHRSGGQSTKGTDCSGFAGHIYRTVYGIEIPRSSPDIYNACIPVKKEKLKEGDFVFFKVGSRSINHVGIYLKDGKFAHASTSKGVMVSSLDEAYWTKYWFSGGRLKP
ncbi:MAG: NlpC/P60 family protein [Flavobacteriales bacterium]|nr:NlpC/P60 family protein [Flavobacteriales bacterium]MDW8432948.1 NlpC/P60 family protein [Flavobacteriales bacterium]